MKRVTFTVAMLLLLTLTISGIPAAQAQSPAPTPTPYAKQKLAPKATVKGVGTAKIVKGTKNTLREGESFAGSSARKAGKEVSKDTGKVKKSLSQDVRKLQNALGGHRKKSAPAATPKP